MALFYYSLIRPYRYSAFQFSNYFCSNLTWLQFDRSNQPPGDPTRIYTAVCGRLEIKDPSTTLRDATTFDGELFMWLRFYDALEELGLKGGEEVSWHALASIGARTGVMRWKDIPSGRPLLDKFTIQHHLASFLTEHSHIL